MSSIVSEDGSVAIPAEIREALGVRPGSRVSVRAESGRIVIEKERDSATDGRFQRLRGCAKMSMSTAELMALTRGED